MTPSLCSIARRMSLSRLWLAGLAALATVALSPLDGAGAQADLREAPGKSGATVRSREVAPAQVPVTPLRGTGNVPAPSAGGKSLGPATAPAPPPATAEPVGGAGPDNAAYEAFDQGRYLTALDLAQKAAAKGDPQAHTLLGRLHAEGFGVTKDVVSAARWYARAGELGDHEGSFALGVLHATGEGVEKSFDKAAQLFEVAARKGHALANYNLALLFLKGSGKPHNPHRAFEHMRYAAEQGVVAAQYDIGTLYTTGTGTDANAFEAARWIGRAAAQGHIEAQVEYAVILLRDHDVPAEEKVRMHREGFTLLLSAATKGSPVAQGKLARCYLHGAGVERNAAEAAKWYLVARAGGVEDETLAAFLAKLPRTERAKAQAAADAWTEQKQVQ